MHTNKLPQPESFDQLVDLIDFKEFEIPRSQEKSSDDFPAYLDNELEKYYEYYKTYIKPYLDDTLSFGGASIIDKISQLSSGINTAVQYYYKGKLPQAADAFKAALNEVGFTHLTAVETIQTGRRFYRTRASSEKQLVKKDLFHNPFQNRGIVATSRYSIPGLPALYLGDSTYVCWEEFNQKPIKDLYFSRFCNEEDLKVIKIQRLEDYIVQIREIETDYHKQLSFLMRYLSLFPLSIACSIKTKSNTDTFKPEYIIPQLLLQYVISTDDAHGIMFPSTKVNYSKIRNVPAYNYIFPVKNIQSIGYCSDLIRLFSLTEPTSTELETLTNFRRLNVLSEEDFIEITDSSRFLTIIENEQSNYVTTAFGFLERVLQQRPVGLLDITE